MLILMMLLTIWNYQKIDDPISAKSGDIFTLTGEWVGSLPSFPYQDAIPRLIMGCQNGKLKFAGFHAGVLLDRREINVVDSRIDNSQGTLLIEPNGDGLSASFNPFRLGTHVKKMVNSQKTILRIKAFGGAYFTMQFDMSDAAQLINMCGLR